MVLSRLSYMKKYVGNKSDSRTKSLKQRGIDLRKYSIKPTPYNKFYKIVRKSPHNDITGYLIGNTIFNAKNNVDRSLWSKKQSWEK